MIRRFAFFLLMLFPLALAAQYSGRRGSGGGSRTPAPGGPVEDPNAAGLEHAVAVQATPAQTAQFKTMTKSADLARRRAIDFQHMNLDPTNSVEVSHQAKALQDALDDAQLSSRDFVGSFTDSQANGLKKLSKKLEKSDAALTKESRKFSEELDRLPLDMPALSQAAAAIEKQLSAFQSDQQALGKEMGITTH